MIATSILIYYVLLLIRGTRAVQILIGILVTVGLLGLANLFQLPLLATILRLMVVGAAVTIPIVFQPELRRALEQIGRGGLFRMESGDGETLWGRPEDRTVALLAHTCFMLGLGRRGALLVLEQQTGLKEYCESGTMMHADISEELLLSIFSVASPLHDGAVIVRERRIEAAGCLLPLAEQSLMHGRLGTRHRAALGLSEQTDAVVVVVSEQTGADQDRAFGKAFPPRRRRAAAHQRCCWRLRVRRAICAGGRTTSSPTCARGCDPDASRRNSFRNAASCRSSERTSRSSS